MGSFHQSVDVAEEEVALAVVLRRGADPDAEALMRFCIEQLPRFAVPRYVRFVASLPKTPSQRIQKYKLRAEGVTDEAFDRVASGLMIPRS